MFKIYLLLISIWLGLKPSVVDLPHNTRYVVVISKIKASVKKIVKLFLKPVVEAAVLPNTRYHNHHTKYLYYF